MSYTKVIKVSDKVYEKLQELAISFRITPSRRCVVTKVGKSCLVECGDGS
jgi:predicted transcriptional regulator